MATDGFSLDGFLFIHQAMRRDTARLACVAAAGPTPDEVAALGRWFARFRHQLDEHHHVEDDVFFPMLRGRDASLGEGFAALEGDHQAMLGLLDRVTDALARGPGRALVEAAAALAELVDRHLSAEETLVVPAVGRLLSAADQRAFEEGLRRKSSLAEMGFALPWIASALPEAERATLLATLPAPLRWVFRLWWQRSYARLAAALSAPAPAASGSAAALAR